MQSEITELDSSQRILNMTALFLIGARLRSLNSKRSKSNGGPIGFAKEES